jgi:orotidine-5'-phosphate decarboxylase
VGLELYAAAGVEFVRELMGEGKDVFLDLKVYDIPETVKRAVAQVARTGVKFLTVHAVGSVMRAAVEGPRRFQPEAAGGHGAHQLRPRGHGRPGIRLRDPDLVALRARKAMELGMDGIVASPLEAAAVRRSSAATRCW